MILCGDALATLSALPSGSVDCCVTSPPYWGLRDYGTDGQLGLERAPGEYVAKLVAIFREVRRVLATDGTLWLNLGDSYAGSRSGPNVGSTLDGSRRNQDESRAAKRAMTASRRRDDQPIPRSDVRIAGLKPKDLVGIPWMVAFALRADGWWLRSEVIWHKPNPMPESVKDRPTRAHETLFLLTKAARYYYDGEAVREAVREPDAGADHRRTVLHRPEPSGGLMAPHRGIRKKEGRNGDGRNRRS
ncbi:MAG TPA: site-specific DNA-methyltransferase, partial [Myxococcales bacterium]|nr:site-specific DNA-methyltransferase [Myxococcales bacterium]